MDVHVPGDRLGPYELDAVLRDDGVVRRYRARRQLDGGMQRPCVLRLMDLRGVDDGELPEQLLDEARQVIALRHPGIAAVQDAGRLDDQLYLEEEPHAGVTLRDVLDREGVLPVGVALRIGAQLAEVLVYVHRARDDGDGEMDRVRPNLAPAHVALTPQGEVRLAGFGGTLFRDTLVLTSARSVRDQVAYLSPEEIVGHPWTRRSDLYSLGCLLCELLRGAPPLQADSIAEARRIAAEDPPRPTGFPADLGDEGTALMDDLLQPEPAARPTDARSVWTALWSLWRRQGEPADDDTLRALVRSVAAVGAVLALALPLGLGGCLPDCPEGWYEVDGSCSPYPPDWTPRWEQIEAGSLHTCARHTHGDVVCWGAGVTEEPCEPGNPPYTFDCGQAAPPAESLIALGLGGHHSCGVRDDRTAVCWGRDDYGQTDVAAVEGNTFAQVDAGLFHSCGINDADQLRCWGNPYSEPVPDGGESFVEVHLAFQSTCARQSDGIVRCDGVDSGEGETEPPPIVFDAFDLGSYHGCGLRPDGEIECWGSDEEGQGAPPAGSFVEVTTGDYHACALDEEGQAHCWGCGGQWDHGQCQAPTVPLRTLAAGEVHTCAITADDGFLCWGCTSPGFDFGQCAPP